MNKRWCKRCGKLKQMESQSQKTCNECWKPSRPPSYKPERVTERIENLKNKYGTRALKKVIDKKWEENKDG